LSLCPLVKIQVDISDTYDLFGTNSNRSQLIIIWGLYNNLMRGKNISELGLQNSLELNISRVKESWKQTSIFLEYEEYSLLI
jgi:hypothetical protein